MTDDLLKAFNEIQMARTPYMLEHFVVGQHLTREQQYAQCVCELQIKYDVIRRALLGREKLQIERAKLEREAMGIEDSGDRRIKSIEAEMKALDVEGQDRAMKGALREFTALYAIFKTFDKQYTREELNKAQHEYWPKRLTMQANQDILATGRVGVGNIDSLRMIGMSPTPELDHVRTVEQKFLEIGDIKLLVCVPTEFKAEQGLPCLAELNIPTTIQVKYLNVHGRKVAEAYNYAAMEAAKDGADFMMTVEDDTFPPRDAFIKLLQHCQQNPKTIWGGWYLKKQEPPTGVPIVIRNGKRDFLDSDGGCHEVYTLPMGCTLFPMQVFLQTVHPWFVTTEHLTQDSFFSQLARDAGWRLMCDTSIRCRHVDRVTGKVYAMADDPAPDAPVAPIHSNSHKIILNIGCGARNENSLPAEFQTDGWRELRIDVDQAVEPDVVASMTDMGQIKDATADVAWSSHQLEHLESHEVMPALRECLRVLKPGGRLIAEVPDLKACCEAVASGDAEETLYVSPAGPIAPLDMLYGHRASLAAGRKPMAHRTGFTAESLKKSLAAAGFSEIGVRRENLALKAIALKA